MFSRNYVSITTKFFFIYSIQFSKHFSNIYYVLNSRASNENITMFRTRWKPNVMQSIMDLLRVWADIWEWRRVSQSILPSACAAGTYTEYGEVGETCVGLWKRSKILAMGTSIPGSGWAECTWGTASWPLQWWCKAFTGPVGTAEYRSGVKKLRCSLQSPAQSLTLRKRESSSQLRQHFRHLHH